MKQSRELLVAVAAAKEAGKAIMRYYGDSCKIRMKSERQGIVTEADIAAEQKIKGSILNAFPNAAILSEEDEQQPAGRDFLWIVDPLDGTLNFSRRIKSFTVSIALWKQGRVVLGVVLNPATKDLFCAEIEKGAFLNGKRIKVSSVPSLGESIIDIGLPDREDARKRDYEMLQKVFPYLNSFRALGSAALQLSLVAAGSLDAFLEVDLHPWDVAAGVLLIEEAGGIVTNEKGERFDIFRDAVLVASNRAIHDTLIRRLNTP
ncbi:MAG: inositol monophosphatase family protein [Candidatus Diapherotrites archaeon]|nr:inositol monophosphatase family protein [Candidatus Diapherotrites archaeon]